MADQLGGLSEYRFVVGISRKSGVNLQGQASAEAVSGGLGAERLQLRRPSFRLTISRRFRMLQHLRQGLPVNSILAARRPLTQFARQNAMTNFSPKFHIGDHSAHLPRPHTPEIRQNDAFPSTIQTQQLNN